MSVLALTLLAAGAAQAPAPPTFAAAVESVYVDLFVTEGSRSIAGLTAADFELRDNGVRQAVELVAVESLPLLTFLVLDASASVDREKLVPLQEAARALLGGLRPGAEAALVTFAEEIRLSVPPTGDRTVLGRGVDQISTGGSTALFDALYATTMLASRRGRSLLVLFTDGEDNLSWLDAPQLQRVLLESNVLVQVVGIIPAEERVSYPDGSLRPPTESP
jgi:VWFA-related protein